MQKKATQKDNQDKWKNEMTPWQIRVFESATGATLEKFGYTLTATGHRLPLLLRVFYCWQNALVIRWYRMFGPKKTPWLPPSPS